MTPSRKMLVALGLLLTAAGCQAPVLRSVLPEQAAPQGIPQEVTGQARPGEVAVTIRWPYRTQVIPTSAERLAFTLSGPHPQTLDVLRPAGTSPVSTATMSVEVGTGYRLTVRAYDGSAQGRLVAEGQSALFDVLTNVLTPVRIRLDGAIKPVITAFAPDNGGPGSSVIINGSLLGAERGFIPSFLFGGIPTTQNYPAQDGTASAVVPLNAVTGAIAPVVDGVQGDAFGTFTVLQGIVISPLSQIVASGSTASFAASATTAGGAAFAGTPAVTWSVTGSGYQGNYDPNDPLATPPPPPPSPGSIDQAGVFSADGATGTFEVAIMSGRLLATASITVTE